MTAARRSVRLVGRLERAIVSFPPSQRRRVAIHVLIWSVVAMVVNVAAYLLGVMDEGTLILITLILSWLAITITAADLVATTDVREEVLVADEDPTGDDHGGDHESSSSGQPISEQRR